MILTFKTQYGKERILGDFKTEKEALKKIKEFLNDHSYKSYYTRVSSHGECKIYDVGSWSENFILYNEGVTKTLYELEESVDK